jgi:membrane glycosyltransferase
LDSLSPGLPPDAGVQPALPPEAPIAMPVQVLKLGPAPHARPVSSPPLMWLRRLLVLGGSLVLTALAAREMDKVLGVNGLTPLEIVILVVFVTLFAWIAMSLISSLAGFVSLLARGGTRLDSGAAAPDGAEAPRVALLMPAYNEAPGRIMAALAVLHGDLVRLGEGGRFDFFILSDTTDPDAWIAEEAAFLKLREHTGSTNIYYRRRARNTERKAGNIGDWVRRWGGAYPLFLILDADSVMTGDCVLRLAGAMARTPDAGLIQSLPVIVGAETLFARLQQFAGRVYGPMIAHGIAWWHGADGNYWGHNAMIRTRAFAEAAGLPTLPGRKPFGGHVLSHDFVEAALMRRAGWAVHMMPALPGSYEECPPSLTELAVRDRRWCQGNLQHIAILPTRGLHPISRLHLLMGIGSYVTAPLWLLFLVMGIMISIQARFVTPSYFPAGPTLFPVWPAVDPVRSMWVFIGTMGLLLVPKLLAWFAMMLRERRGFGGAIRTLLGVLVESVLAGLLAPVTMLTQTASVLTILGGRDGGWSPQRREGGGVPFRDTLRQYLPHTLTGLGLAYLSWLVSVPLLLWMSPVVIGLALAAPLAWFTARLGVGRALRRLGILRTPEETMPPDALLAVQRLTPLLAPTPMDGIERLFSDTALLAAHRAMLPPPRQAGEAFDPALLVGLAKLQEAGSLAEAGLTRAERAAVLGDAAGLQRLAMLMPGAAAAGSAQLGDQVSGTSA